jgi:hypothetical protein
VTGNPPQVPANGDHALDFDPFWNIQTGRLLGPTVTGTLPQISQSIFLPAGSYVLSFAGALEQPGISRRSLISCWTTSRLPRQRRSPGMAYPWRWAYWDWQRGERLVSSAAEPRVARLQRLACPAEAAVYRRYQEGSRSAKAAGVINVHHSVLPVSLLYMRGSFRELTRTRTASSSLPRRIRCGLWNNH